MIQTIDNLKKQPLPGCGGAKKRAKPQKEAGEARAGKG
jgi:hypothetical protein